MHFVLCFCCLLVANDDNDSDQNGTSFTNKRKTYTQILIWLILCANPLDCICSRSRSKKMFFFGLPYCEIFKWMADWWSWTIELMMLMDMCLCSFIFFFIIATLVLLYSWRKRRKWKKNIFFGNAYNIQWSSKWCTIHITYYTHPFGVRTFWFCLNCLFFILRFGITFQMDLRIININGTWLLIYLKRMRRWNGQRTEKIITNLPQ